MRRGSSRPCPSARTRPDQRGRRSPSTATNWRSFRPNSTERRSSPEAFQASASQFVLPNPPRGAFTLKIETRLDPAANTKLMGLYRSGSAYCTQCEAEGFRRITYFLDRPDVLSTYRVRLEADREEAPVLLEQRQPREQGPVRNERPPLGGLDRSAQEALLPVRSRRRRPRPHFGHVRHRFRTQGRSCDLHRTRP